MLKATVVAASDAKADASVLTTDENGVILHQMQKYRFCTCLATLAAVASMPNSIAAFVTLPRDHVPRVTRYEGITQVKLQTSADTEAAFVNMQKNFSTAAAARLCRLTTLCARDCVYILVIILDQVMSRSKRCTSASQASVTTLHTVLLEGALMTAASMLCNWTCAHVLPSAAAPMAIPACSYEL